MLDGFQFLAALVFVDDLRPADGKLEAFAAERFDQDHQLELAPAADQAAAADVAFLDLQRDVLHGFLAQALDQLAGL